MLSFDQTEYLKKIGSRVKEERIRQGISKVQLAFEIETSESNIRRIEKGEVNVGIITLLKLSKALNIPIIAFLDFDH